MDPRRQSLTGISVACIESDGSPRAEPHGDLCRLYWIRWIPEGRASRGSLSPVLNRMDPRGQSPTGISVACIGSDGSPRAEPHGDLCRLYWIGWIPEGRAPRGFWIEWIPVMWCLAPRGSLSPVLNRMD